MTEVQRARALVAGKRIAHQLCVGARDMPREKRYCSACGAPYDAAKERSLDLSREVWFWGRELMRRQLSEAWVFCDE